MEKPKRHALISLSRRNQNPRLPASRRRHGRGGVAGIPVDGEIGSRNGAVDQADEEDALEYLEKQQQPGFGAGLQQPGAQELAKAQLAVQAVPRQQRANKRP